MSVTPFSPAPPSARIPRGGGVRFVLSALMKLAGLRQAEVAQVLGVNRSTLASWLSGYAPMPDDVILKTHRLVSSRLNRLPSQVDDLTAGESE